MTGLRLLQVNLNHCWNTHDFLLHNVAELNIGVCAVSEPVHVSDSQLWFSSLNGSAAVYWCPDRLNVICTLIRKGQYSVSV